MIILTAIICSILSLIGGIITGYFLSGDIVSPLYLIGFIFLFGASYLDGFTLTSLYIVIFMVGSFISAMINYHVPPALER